MERRTFIRQSALTAFSISAFGNLSWNGKAFEADSPTTTDILGPFYRPGAPMRSNLRMPGSGGQPIVLKGVILKEDGKSPVPHALVEIWHCDEKEVYDNTTDDYRYRGAQRTSAHGKYSFQSILPVPYQATPGNESSWRPAHIHMRVSVPREQDLITQIYFQGGKYNDTDEWASNPAATKRILPISDLNTGEKEIIFNVIMKKELPLDDMAYKKIAGVYDIGMGNFMEFIRNDDLLFCKRNGLLVAALHYIGNNTFEGGTGSLKTVFEPQEKGEVHCTIKNGNQTFKGTKFLKYNG